MKGTEVICLNQLLERSEQQPERDHELLPSTGKPKAASWWHHCDRWELWGTEPGSAVVHTEQGMQKKAGLELRVSRQAFVRTALTLASPDFPSLDSYLTGQCNAEEICSPALTFYTFKQLLSTNYC